MMSDKIPVYAPNLSGNEKKYVMECLESTWISSKGRFISEFEQSFSRYTNVKYSASVCNGTVALHLALLALGFTGPESTLSDKLGIKTDARSNYKAGYGKYQMDRDWKFSYKSPYSCIRHAIC